MTALPSPYLLAAVSNGNMVEQALIRRWWREAIGARGLLVWEYYLEGFYADALVFLDLHLDPDPPHRRELVL